MGMYVCQKCLEKYDFSVGFGIPHMGECEVCWCLERIPAPSVWLTFTNDVSRFFKRPIGFDYKNDMEVQLYCRARLQFIDYTKRAREILDGESLPDDERYKLIFCEDFSMKIWKLPISFEYYDPDTSYMEDMTALVTAMEEKTKDLLKEIEEENE